MSYEDLEEARAKRVEKESAQEAKSKRRRGRKPKGSPPDEGTADTARRSRKRKSAAQEVPEPSIEVARGSVTVSAVQLSGTPVAEDEIVPKPWRAPVARMY